MCEVDYVDIGTLLPQPTLAKACLCVRGAWSVFAPRHAAVQLAPHQLRSIEAQLLCPRGPTDVRFGSKADICAATRNVRFTPNSDRESGLRQTAMSALPPKADMCGARGDVC
jgi:hypothetical protein